VALVAAFASDVELYLLDEPTSGLDPLMEIVFQEVVRELRDEGRTVLLSSHILAEVEALCDRVTIIRAGRATESGSFADLRHLTRTTVVVETEKPISALSDLPGVHDARVDQSPSPSTRCRSCSGCAPRRPTAGSSPCSPLR
jgi:ABC-2 type transport system ATP-binding protein